MTIFRYSADRFPITIFILLFCADLGVYIFVSNVYLLVTYSVASIFIKAFICAWNHHHQHSETFTIPLFNRILEIIYGFQT